MLSNIFYNHNSIEKVIIGFGTLFSNIYLKRTNTNDLSQTTTIKVPILYSSRDRMLVRAREVPELETDSKVGFSYPQMAFEMTGLSYDASRKLNTLNKLYNCAEDGTKSVLVPIPYNLDFELSIVAVSNREILQIVEQILPQFTPSITLRINTLTGFPSTEVPINLNSVDIQDNYDGNFVTDTREIIYTLRFTAKANIFGGVTDNSGKLIKTVIVNINTETNVPIATITTTPVATTDLNFDGVVNAGDTAILNATDDFGFNTIFT